jgi:hypothetical protein
MPKKACVIIRHGRHEQVAIEEKISHLAARLGDEQAAVARGAMRGAVAAAVVWLVIGADRIARLSLAAPGELDLHFAEPLPAVRGALRNP